MARSENAIITALCMIYKGDKLLMQQNVKGWRGLTFPGGHIEPEESFVKGIKREILEETGLTIYNPKLCALKQFITNKNERYIVYLYKTNEFEGDIVSSEEGEMLWLKREDLTDDNTADGFFDTLKAIDDDSISELIYERTKTDSGYTWQAKFY